jgi:hypothetical protein
LQPLLDRSGRSYLLRENGSTVTRVVPNEIEGRATSLAPGRTLSYFGYEFEVPRSGHEELTGVTPTEINRIVLPLHKTASATPIAPRSRTTANHRWRNN